MIVAQAAVADKAAVAEAEADLGKYFKIQFRGAEKRVQLFFFFIRRMRNAPRSSSFRLRGPNAAQRHVPRSSTRVLPIFVLTVSVCSYVLYSLFRISNVAFTHSAFFLKLIVVPFGGGARRSSGGGGGDNSPGRLKRIRKRSITDGSQRGGVQYRS